MEHVNPSSMSQRTAALTAGTALLVMALAAFFAFGYAHGRLVQLEDADATLSNLLSSRFLFKAEIVGWLTILVCDIVAAWAFYAYLKPYQPQLALLGAWLRLLYSALLGAAILQLVNAALATEPSGLRDLLTATHLQAHVMLSLAAFEAAWSFGLIVFGGHLLVIGFIALRARPIPRWIGICLLIAAVGYLFTHIVSLVYTEPNKLLETINLIGTVPMTVGELGFGLWLLVRGGKAAS